MQANPRLPNFFIVGAPKAGTTSLYAYLDQHPEVYMSPLKEPNYFAFELRAENFSKEDQPRIAREAAALRDYLDGDMRDKRFGGLVSDWLDYGKLFRNASTETAIGEASPMYLWSGSAAHNIARRLPHAKIIISLRNPVDRAYSQYLQMTSIGMIRRSFRQQIQASMMDERRCFGPSWPLLEFGQYHAQVLEIFTGISAAADPHLALRGIAGRAARVAVELVPLSRRPGGFRRRRVATPSRTADPKAGRSGVLPEEVAGLAVAAQAGAGGMGARREITGIAAARVVGDGTCGPCISHRILPRRCREIAGIARPRSECMARFRPRGMIRQAPERGRQLPKRL